MNNNYLSPLTIGMRAILLLQRRGHQNDFGKHGTICRIEPASISEHLHYGLYLDEDCPDPQASLLHWQGILCRREELMPEHDSETQTMLAAWTNCLSEEEAQDRDLLREYLYASIRPLSRGWLFFSLPEVPGSIFLAPSTSRFSHYLVIPSLLTLRQMEDLEIWPISGPCSASNPVTGSLKLKNENEQRTDRA